MRRKIMATAVCAALALTLSGCGGSKAPASPKAFEPLSANDDQRAQINQAFANLLEALRANKSIDADQIKRLQTLLQQMKDSGTATSDYISTFIDLLRSISQKISQ